LSQQWFNIACELPLAQVMGCAADRESSVQEQDKMQSMLGQGMSDAADATTTAAPASFDPRSTTSVQNDLEHLEDRDVQLWSVSLLVALVLAAGFCALLVPRMLWHADEVRIDSPYMPQIFFGFVALIALFNAYVYQQRRLLRNLRRELMRQLLRAKTAENVAQIDPLTETMNRRWMDAILEREMNRTDRVRGALTVMMVDVDDFKVVNTRFGHLMGDRLLQDIARMLKKTFRASDVVFRYGGDEFIVVMVDTGEEQAKVALDRLHGNVEKWNQHAGISGWKLSLSCGYLSYKTGMGIEEMLTTADQRMYEDKHRADLTPAKLGVRTMAPGTA